MDIKHLMCIAANGMLTKWFMGCNYCKDYPPNNIGNPSSQKVDWSKGTSQPIKSLRECIQDVVREKTNIDMGCSRLHCYCYNYDCCKCLRERIGVIKSTKRVKVKRCKRCHK